LSLKRDLLVSKFASKFNLYRYTTETERKSDVALTKALDDLTAALSSAAGAGAGAGAGASSTRPPRRCKVGAHARAALAGAGAVLHGLLMNDSFVDWAERSSMYRAVLAAVDAFAGRAALAKLLLGGGGDASSSSRSSADALETLETQANVFVERAGGSAVAPVVNASMVDQLRGGRGGRGAKEEGNDDPTLELSRRIQKAAAGVRAAAAKAFTSERKRGGGGGGSEGRYVRAMRALLFGSAPLLRNHGHHFAPSARAAAAGGGGEMERKRSKRIAIEVSSLAASLPVFWVGSDTTFHFTLLFCSHKTRCSC
jgi:hypothetical protein